MGITEFSHRLEDSAAVSKWAIGVGYGLAVVALASLIVEAVSHHVLPIPWQWILPPVAVAGGLCGSWGIRNLREIREASQAAPPHSGDADLDD